MQLNFRPYKTLAFSLLEKLLLTPYITPILSLFHEGKLLCCFWNSESVLRVTADREKIVYLRDKLSRFSPLNRAGIETEAYK